MSAMNERYLPTGARIILGAIFLVFGLNGFMNFMPMPEMPGAAGEFMGALAATGYMFPLIKIVEVVGGLLLLVDRCVPLALALLTPGIVNIAFFHAFLAPAGLPMAGLLVALALYLAWSFRDVYRPMLSPRSVPTAKKSPTERFQYDSPAHRHAKA
jgi:uncharacterized membrane protein YphA (DoxX/SURF4 family)